MAFRCRKEVYDTLLVIIPWGSFDIPHIFETNRITKNEIRPGQLLSIRINKLDASDNLAKGFKITLSDHVNPLHILRAPIYGNLSLKLELDFVSHVGRSSSGLLC